MEACLKKAGGSGGANLSRSYSVESLKDHTAEVS